MVSLAQRGRHSVSIRKASPWRERKKDRGRNLVALLIPQVAVRRAIDEGGGVPLSLRQHTDGEGDRKGSGHAANGDGFVTRVGWIVPQRTRRRRRRRRARGEGGAGGGGCEPWSPASAGDPDPIGSPSRWRRFGSWLPSCVVALSFSLQNRLGKTEEEE